MTASRTNLLDFDLAGLQAFFVMLGEKPFRATQLLKWIHQEGETDFAVMTNLSKALRARLAELCEIRPPEVAEDHQSADGSRKWLFRLQDGNCIETVFIPEKDRGTLCVSSQVGCALNCSFCSTAQQGFNRNLTTAEIIGQVWLANRLLAPHYGGERAVTNVVMMGMGEPLLNLDAVIPAMRIMLDDNAYGLSKRRVTLSTSGVVPMLDQLSAQCDVALAVSLHAPNDELRNELVPINRKYPIRELLDACWRYVDREGRRRVTFEYVLLDGVNDSDAHARELVKLLRHKPAKVNLIPFNPFPHTRYRRSSDARIDRFFEILVQANITTITRRTRGDDIAAACGQLAGDFQDRTQRRIKRMDLHKGEIRGVSTLRMTGLALLALLLVGCATTPSAVQDARRAALANVELGVAYYREGRLQLAMENLRRAVDLDPTLPEAHAAIAMLYARLGEVDPAERHYRRALSLAPKDPRVHNNFGQFLCQQQRLEEADRHFRQAVADPLYETPEAAYTNAGICALRVPDPGRAEDYFRLALERNPFYPLALLQMLRLSHDQGDFLRARAYLQRFQQVSRHTAESLWLGIRIEDALGDKNAVASYGLALRNHFPDAPQTRAYLDWLNERP